MLFCIKRKLWFDVEKRYNTTIRLEPMTFIQLWFDVEKRYNTTAVPLPVTLPSCGLM